MESVVSLCQQLVDDGIVTELSGASALSRERTEGDFLWRVTANEHGEFNESLDNEIKVVGSDRQVAAIERTLPAGWSLRRTSLIDLAASGAVDGWVIVWSPHLNDRDLRIWNERAYYLGTRWLPISGFDGHAAVVGPLIFPPDTPCYECYRRRRASNSGLGNKLLELLPAGGPVLTNSALTHLLASLAVLHVQSWCAQEDPYVPGALTVVTLTGGLEVRREYVMRVPRCRACRAISASTREMPWAEVVETATSVSTAGERP